MRNLKKFTKVFALALALTMTVPVGMPAANAVVAEAAAVKLSAAKKTLTVGKTYTLKMQGTKKKVTWKTSKKTVATVNSKGKVTAKKAGTATITAKVGSKSYKCKITVKNPVNKYVAKAPFTAKEAKAGKYTMAVPKDWTLEKKEMNGINGYILYPTKEDMGSSNIAITTMQNDLSVQSNFPTFSEYVKSTVTEDYIKNALGGLAEIKDFKFEEADIKLGKATKVSYTVEMTVGEETMVLKQVIYDIFADGYTTEVTVTDNGTKVSPDVYKVADYLVNSLIYVK